MWLVVTAALAWVAGSLGLAGPTKSDRPPELWKAAAVKVRITPDQPLWLTGFAARTNVSQGVFLELYAKALALEDTAGKRAVLVTTDLIGFPAPVSERIFQEAKRQYGLERERLILSASHTHGAPGLHSPIRFIYGPRATPAQWLEIEAYTAELEMKIVTLIGEALSNLQPARLDFGQGQAEFGINRRKLTPKGVVSFVQNPDGPVDQAVPVLRVRSGTNQLLAIVFGYAAHPTSIIEGPAFYQVSSDYPGVAQAWLEQQHPGTVALFVQGCGGDISVYPRGGADPAHRHGERLARAVEQTLATQPLSEIGSRIRCGQTTVPIEFATPKTRAQFEEQLKHPDRYFQWHARQMLEAMEREGQLPARYPYPVQAWHFGADLTLIALAGEVVVDYSLRLKKELGPEKVWVAGYCNDVFAYIPTARIVKEGGYEGAGAMIYYVQPGPFAPSVEETIIEAAHRLVKTVRE